MAVRQPFLHLWTKLLSVLAACAGVLFGAASARADDPPPEPDRPWSIEFALGVSFGGPLDDIVSAMEGAGFDDEVGHGEWGHTDYPFKATDTGSWWCAARRRIGHEPWFAGIGVGWSNFGTVYGNRTVGGPADPDYRLVAAVEMTTFTPMAWYQALPAARLGFGLGLNRVETWFGSQHSGEDSTSWEPGLVVEAAVTTPPAKRFYLLLILRYQLMQDDTLGPLQETASTGEEIVFPETNVTLSHGVIGVGLGIRF